MGFFSDMIRPIIDFALPPRCPICGIIVESDHRFCLSCWDDLDFLTEPWCAGCGRPFAFEQEDDALCISCLQERQIHDGVRAVVAYDEHSSILPMRLKYGGRLGLADLIAAHLMRFVPGLPDNTLIMPVPLHRWRLWSRGFNQSVLIARSLEKQSGFDMDCASLLRRHATPVLRSMSAKQREKVVKNVFAIAADRRSTIEGRTVILVDDVYTTGATAGACSRLLRECGADRILIFCWARVLKGQADS
ncbi:MAG: ComF family protein [Parasphingorhabdus sp.]|uniref:ComF family protein n=1 Tax=Parasphingorhabdus sp. TaxID=2709688 RepID=UPI00329A273C